MKAETKYISKPHPLGPRASDFVPMNVAAVVLLLVTTFFRFLAIPVPSEGSSDGESSQQFLVSTEQGPRIVGGDGARPTRFPYYVALVGPGGDSVVCGGTLIASDVVLTAAHCNM
jgi:V8-like Glu-specific endopeptidase